MLCVYAHFNGLGEFALIYIMCIGVYRVLMSFQQLQMYKGSSSRNGVYNWINRGG